MCAGKGPVQGKGMEWNEMVSEYLVIGGKGGRAVGLALAKGTCSKGCLLLSSRLCWLRKRHQEWAGTAGVGQAVALGLLQMQVLREGPHWRVHQQVRWLRARESLQWEWTMVAAHPPRLLKCIHVPKYYCYKTFKNFILFLL